MCVCDIIFCLVGVLRVYRKSSEIRPLTFLGLVECYEADKQFASHVDGLLC